MGVPGIEIIGVSVSVAVAVSVGVSVSVGVGVSVPEGVIVGVSVAVAVPSLWPLWPTLISVPPMSILQPASAVARAAALDCNTRRRVFDESSVID
jgi:hypothetical protein